MVAQEKRRVACFVDGFNLYHAIKQLQAPHLKWLDLWKLAETYTDRAIHQLSAVYYFTAYATWLEGPFARHQAYVEALKLRNVTPVLGQFKEKQVRCKSCGALWKKHEEKETDVNLALWLLNEARADSYDVALLITRDSDLAPAVRMLRNEFPKKQLKLIAPPGLRHSKELARAVGNQKNLRSLKSINLERARLPEQLLNPHTGNSIVCPQEYLLAPPL